MAQKVRNQLVILSLPSLLNVDTTKARSVVSLVFSDFQMRTKLMVLTPNNLVVDRA